MSKTEIVLFNIINIAVYLLLQNYVKQNGWVAHNGDDTLQGYTKQI
jgi:hypothetical protein